MKSSFDMAVWLLEENYDKVLKPAIKEIWREFLENALTEDELTEAAKHAVLHSRFMPTPGDLVDYINGGKESKAIAEWQTILAAAASDAGRAQELLAYASPRCQVALRAIGGLRTVANVEGDFQRQSLQKQFTTVYCQCPDKDITSLPPASPQSSTEARAGVEEPVPMPLHIKESFEALKAKIAMGKKPLKKSESIAVPEISRRGVR